MRVLLLGYGNPGRGDDGLGLALVEALAERFPKAIAQLAMQLQPEHVLDLAACDLALLADAGMRTPSPFTFKRLHPRQDLGVFSHALSPQGLLAVYQKVMGRTAPPVFLLAIAGESFNLGSGLSPKARENLRLALNFAEALLRVPELAHWEAACTSCL